MPNIEDETKIETIIRLRTEGLKPKAIAEHISTEEEPVKYQEVVKLAKEYDLAQTANDGEDGGDDEFDDTKPKTKTVKKKALEGEVITKPEKFMATMTQPEYEEYSLAAGRTRYGGEKGVKVVATIEELRAYINSHWTPSMLMEKWQMTEKEMTQLVWKLSKAELRDRPIKVNFKNDFFR